MQLGSLDNSKTKLHPLAEVKSNATKLNLNQNSQK